MRDIEFEWLKQMTVKDNVVSADQQIAVIEALRNLGSFHFGRAMAEMDMAGVAYHAADRAADRLLQKLRKNGYVVHSSGEWR